ncbi:MAG: PEP-CTERM sorting domain-containing protein [Spirulinaceae cyanobacterium SM2_1_0]|nr:PEP-CTERM sorting domain-containing protein [Spirulinaceae cyanobacterium SM2_1_0]
MTKAVSKLVQRSALLTGGALITTAALLVAEPAAAIRIDFDESNVVTGPGEIITDQWAADYGLTVSATDKGGKNSRNLLLFNSSCDPVANDGSTDDLTLCTGGDRDLATGVGSYRNNNWDIDYDTPDQGNVLIIQEGGDLLNPDDHAGGGWINFDFAEALTFQSIGFLDLDDAGLPDFLFTFADGSTQLFKDMEDSDPEVTIVGQSSQTRGSNTIYNAENSLREYSFYLDNVVKASVKLPSSGAIAYLDVDYNQVEVPEPMAMAGLGVIAGSLLAARRRRNLG